MEVEIPLAWPARDLVLDEAAALVIGKALIHAYFGDAVFEKWAPYKAHRMFDEWTVFGTNAKVEAEVRKFEQLHPGSMMFVRGGGMPGVSFTAYDARVTSICYER